MMHNLLLRLFYSCQHHFVSYFATLVYTQATLYILTVAGFLDVPGGLVVKTTVSQEREIVVMGLTPSRVELRAPYTSV